jgi:protein-S-isoprenylcysteine O-methyltransferase Ste14
MKAHEVGWAQVFLSVLFIFGYFSILAAFMTGWVRVPIDFKDAFTALLGVITASVVQILGYWFSRQRPDGNPPANGG